MKITNVVLKAFRLFDDERLDFVNHSKGRTEAANLVVIHAPNGFGKTSFFDAIEFAITKNIKRLKRNDAIFKENVKLDKQTANSSFIHNSKLKDEQLEVRVDFDGDLSFVRHPEKEEEHEWLLGDPENSYFANVMLAQDWFSAFLSTTNAEERFKMFLNNFEQTRGLLEYHSKLKYTGSSLGRSLKPLEREVKNLEKQLKDAVDDDIKDRLSAMVNELKELGIDLKWDGHINERSLTALDVESGQMEELQREQLKTLKDRLQHGDDVREGHDNLLSVSTLPVHRERISSLRKSILKAQEMQKKVQQLKDTVKQVGEHEQKRQELVRANERLKKLIQKRGYFITLEQQRLKYEKKIQQMANAIGLDTKALTLMTTEQQQNQAALEQAKLVTVAAQTKLDTLEEKHKSYITLKKEYDEAAKSIAELSQKQTALATEKDNLAKKELRLQGVISKLTKRALDVEVEEYNEQSLAIIALINRIKKTNKDLTGILTSIEEQQKYQGQVEQLVAKSREMADTLKTGDCPLCGHHYETVDDLLKSIENNKAVSAVMESLIARKNELNKSIEDDTVALEEAYSKMESIVNGDLAVVRTNIAAKDKEIAGMALQQNGLIQRQTEIKQAIENNYGIFRDVTLEQLNKAYQEERDNAAKQEKAREEALAASNKKVTEITDKIKALNDQMAAQTEKSKQISNDNEYVAYLQLLDGEAFDDDAFKGWEEQAKVYIAQTTEREQKIKELKEIERNLRENEKVAEAMEPELAQNLAILKQEHGTLKEQYKATVRFIHDDCAVADIELLSPPDEIVKRFEQTMTSHQKNKERTEGRIQALLRFNALNGQAKKYWEQQKTRKLVETKRKECKTIESNQQQVKKELERLETFLDKYVKNFFHLELINKLYNTIDPHPIYKSISFEPNFSTTNPKLNVYMRAKREDEGDIVPNLYFSTAQINILSFCIFLAKAIFAHTKDNKDIGCIFIDDPIQALDDINILSMIDMLRNIAFTLDRQIILTTHDRNFFELLQKKMPQEKFNACYYRLKERGKFEQVI